jgi:hypothetical protein
VRLDHLLSKESFPGHSGQGLPSRSLVIRFSFVSRRLPSAHIPSGMCPAGPVFRAAEGSRTSLFRFEGVTVFMSLPSRCRPSYMAVGLSCIRTASPQLVSSLPGRCASLENSIASTSIFVLQATKSQRWMPRRLKPKKDVGGCEKPRGAAYQASIRGCPNGETRHPSWGVTPV